MRRTLLIIGFGCAIVHAQESRPAPTKEEIPAAVAHATQLLLAAQENYVEKAPPKERFKSDDEKTAYEEKRKAEEAKLSAEIGPVREWPYQGVYRVNRLIPPGYRVGGTAICCWALLEAPGFSSDAPRQETFARGIAFIFDMLEKDPLLASGFEGTYDVRGWAHAYALRTLLRGLELGVLKDAIAARARKTVQKLVVTLQETEIVESGGWNYARRGGGKKPADPSTFMTAPTLQALFQARQQGFEVSNAVIERALKSLEDGRLDTGAFQYTTSKRKTGEGFEDVPGACARMAVAETTLHLAGRGSVDRIRGAVAAFFEHWKWLEQRRRQSGTHIPPYMIAPYYFHYGHTYVAQAIEQLPESERPALRTSLRALYWQTREKDGGWNDREFPRSQSFGTAMVILGLQMPTMPAPAKWGVPR